MGCCASTVTKPRKPENTAAKSSFETPDGDGIVAKRDNPSIRERRKFQDVTGNEAKADRQDTPEDGVPESEEGHSHG